jgi:hypothetical protein
MLQLTGNLFGNLEGMKLAQLRIEANRLFLLDIIALQNKGNDWK